MKLKEILANSNWLAVKEELLSLYPDQQGNLIGYEQVFQN